MDVQGDFRYQPVLMHERATSIHRTHSNANTYLEVFDVQGHPGGEDCSGGRGCGAVLHVQIVHLECCAALFLHMTALTEAWVVCYASSCYYRSEQNTSFMQVTGSCSYTNSCLVLC